MPTLTLRPSHKAVAAYYESLAAFKTLGTEHELAVKTAFAMLLETAAKPFGWKLVPEHSMRAKGGKRIQPDGTLMDVFRLHHGHWEAKDSSDDLTKEIRAKIDKGYPTENLLFWEPRRAVLYQHGNRLADVPLDQPEALLGILRQFLEFAPEAIAQWEAAVTHFKDIIPTLGKALAAILKKARTENPKYAAAFAAFVTVCRGSLNPNLAELAVEEMLVQHLLTERILRKIFDIEDFRQRNVIAADIEKVIATLTAKHFSRDDFLKALDPFYKAIETAAETFTDFTEKQKFLNIVYERFFQGFAVKQADVLGVVYTPQPLVQFMIASVEHVLKEHFDTTLGAKGVHIFDPFTGTGNFIVNIMQAEHLPGSALKHKFLHELHCNEVSLLPYYVASMNIEHAYYERMQQYESFEGICLVDTFETVEKEQGELPMFNEENSERVKKQRAVKDLRVIIANPPYNAGQQDENDNNKNRKHPEMDRRVKHTYSDDSRATLKNSLGDPYIKAFRFASDRIGDSGIVCYVSNNGFVDGIACDGMRKHLAEDFDLIYVLDLGGNVRKNPKLSGTTHNVFGIQVGVCVTILVRLPKMIGGKAAGVSGRVGVPPAGSGILPEQSSAPGQTSATGQTSTRAKVHEGETPSPAGGTPTLPGKRRATIHYHAVPVDWRREQKERYLDEAGSIAGVKWGKPLKPDRKSRWLGAGSDDRFGEFVAIGSKESKAAGGASGQTIFRNYSRGISTGRDSSIFAFPHEPLGERAGKLIETYNLEVMRFSASKRARNVEEFIASGAADLKWTDRLKEALSAKRQLTYDESLLRNALYRPFTRKVVYFDDLLTHRRYQQHNFFPDPASESSNRVISLTDLGSEKPFMVFVAGYISDLHLVGAGATSQCFPLYDFSTGERRDNIGRNALDRFIAHYDDDRITREDIFYYVYAVLHHPEYRARYAENLKRELPRIPLVGLEGSAPSLPGGHRRRDALQAAHSVFHAFAQAGRKLADLHVGYESVKPFKLQRIENNEVPPNWRVETMKLTKEGDAVIYNDWLTLYGVPPEAHAYRLGNRSALAWVIDQYRVDRDADGEITSDPNPPDDEEAIVRLLGQVVTVSVETMKLIRALPELQLP